MCSHVEKNRSVSGDDVDNDNKNVALSIRQANKQVHSLSLDGI